MFRGPHFIISTMQAGTTPIFKVFGLTGPSNIWESNPQKLLVGARTKVPPIVAFYDQQGILRTMIEPPLRIPTVCVCGGGGGGASFPLGFDARTTGYSF